MPCVENSFEGTGGVPIFYRVWQPEGRPRALFILVHGMGEHSGRYDPVARFLAGRGLVVWALDHRGHGRSGGELGTVERFEHFLDDLEAFHRRALEVHPDLPTVLFGHSMGGLIVTPYLLERPLRPDLVVLSGPALVPILDPHDNTIDPTRLSRDPEAWKAYLEDPLILRERVQQGLFVALAEGLATIVGRAAELDHPILLLHGSADRLCSAEGAKAFLESSSSRDLTIKIYPDGRHEMLNEINRDEVLEDMWAWLDARLPR
ncbi:MAG TPA: alpha/beta hydrolase [Candidatus Limnocylindrales bacterium]|nr:alpha/beta hydrolase [Candidatus Limnocylindrales bacterium]